MPFQLICDICKSTFESERKKATCSNTCRIKRKIEISKKKSGLSDEDFHRSNWLKRAFGMTLNEYRQMVAEQHSSCFICKRHEDQLTRALCIDHDHCTGFVRKLLCHNCNAAIGLLKDDPVLLRKAADYIEQHHDEPGRWKITPGEVRKRL